MDGGNHIEVPFFAGEITSADLRDLAVYQLRPLLSRVPGVANVEVLEDFLMLARLDYAGRDARDRDRVQLKRILLSGHDVLKISGLTVRGSTPAIIRHRSARHRCSA